MSQYSNQLKSLPELTPPVDAWPAIAAKLEQKRRMPRRYQWLAIAAAAVLAVIWLPRYGQETARAPQPSVAANSVTNAGTDVAGNTAPDPQLAQWVKYSQELEQQLRSLRADSSAYRGQHAAVLSELENRVASVDWQLELPLSTQDQRELWQQRATLLHDLVTVEAANRLAINNNPQPVRTLTRPRAVAASFQL